MRHYKTMVGEGYKHEKCEPLSFISTVPSIMSRIHTSNRDSPISVFKITDKTDKEGLCAVFTNTYNTKKAASEDNPSYIGTYYRGSSPTKVINGVSSPVLHK